MESKGRAEVRIFGQTYTIAGDASTDSIIKIAKYVNDKMQEVSVVAGNASTVSVAVLAAINIAEDLYRTVEQANEIQKHANQMQKNSKKHDNEISNYQKLWEETQHGFNQCRQELQTAKDNAETCRRTLEEKTEECSGLKKELKDKDRECEKRKRDYEKLKEFIAAAETLKRETEAKKKALDLKEKEFENEFIEIQMENVKLKNELEKYRKDISER